MSSLGCLDQEGVMLSHVVKVCPNCGSKNLRFASGSTTAGIYTAMYSCIKWGAYISKNEYSPPLVTMVVEGRTGRPINPNKPRGSSSSSGCCAGAVVLILWFLSNYASMIFF